MRADLGELFRTFERTAWRLETLPRYTVPDEEQSYAAFLAGEPVPARTPDNNGWIKLLADAQGRSFGRVHVVSRPLTPYLRFEFGGYRENVAHGEDVRIADSGDHPEIADLGPDFWIFDDEIVAVMIYDLEGRFTGATLADADAGPAAFRRMRDRAIAASVPLAEYEERLTVGS